MTDPLIVAKGLSKVYAARHGTVHALRNLDVELRQGEVLAVVGESGSGKSTLADLVLGIQAPTSGEIWLRGSPLARSRPPEARRALQLVPQNPLSALNPRRTIFQSVALPLAVHGLRPRAQHRERARELLEMVGLPADILDRQPQILSGGQRQRVAIARALAAEPEAIVLDEPTSALDVSVQARVLRLLADIRRRLGLAYLFVTHDLAVARILADRVVVLYKGQVVEAGPVAQVLLAPRHRYSQMLSSSLPVVSREEEAIKPTWSWTKKVTADAASERGCPFSQRCPYATEPCFTDPPPLLVSPTGREARCFNPGPDETDAWLAAAAAPHPSSNQPIQADHE